VVTTAVVAAGVADATSDEELVPTPFAAVTQK
jgi:hypothetical protein